MKNLKKNIPIRDFLLALLLLILIKPALYMSAKRMREEQKQSHVEFLFHEPDQEVIQAIKTAKEQIEQTIVLAQQKRQKPELIQQLNDFSATLTTIEHRYKTNSPALLFLGPFATVSIVLKELELENEFKTLVSKLNNTLHFIQGQPNEKHNEKTLTAQLQENHDLLNNIVCS
jgi:hypothetical protein